MKRNRQSRFRDSVSELDARIGRAENFIQTEEDKMEVGKGQEVYRDKNTLVEVTIHRKGNKSKSSQNWDTNLSEPPPTYSKPTYTSSTRAVRQVPSPPKKSEGFGAMKKTNRRTIKELLAELREIVEVSGVKDVHDFLEDIEKIKVVKGSLSRKKSPARSKSPQRLCHKPDHSQFELKIDKLEKDCSKYKCEAARYKQEYDVLQKQLEISKDTSSGLETQLTDLKRIVSRLTRNNSDLLSIVSEKINYEDKMAALQQRLSSTQAELVREKEKVEQLERVATDRGDEVVRLRSLTTDLRAGLQHGLAGLELPRAVSSARGEVTRDLLLGISAVSEKGVSHGSDTDSAIEDPNSESLKSRPKSQQQQQVGLSVPQPSKQQNIIRHNVGQSKAPLVEDFRTPHTPPTKMGSFKPPSTQHHYQALLPTLSRQPTISLPPTIHTGFSHPPTITRLTPQTFSAPATLLPPHQSPVRQALFPEDIQRPRSSTLLEEQDDPTTKFQAVPLNLSETVSVTETDGPTKTNTTVVENLRIQRSTEHLLVKEKSVTNLENKVQDFLFRLNQDSINLSLELPQPARSFPGPSLHLSLSGGSELGDVTANTSLSEGKFLRGLETSLEVGQGEVSSTSSS